MYIPRSFNESDRGARHGFIERHPLGALVTASGAGQSPSWIGSESLRFIDDRDFLMVHLDRLTNRHEASQSHPWAMHDAPLDFLEQLARAIVGVEIDITSLEGKFKLSQNRSDADVHGVVSGLEASTSTHDRAVADAMREHTRPDRAAR